MKNLYLTVEGQTEEAFALALLQPHLVQFGVYLWPPRFTGPHGRRHGRIPTGGMFNTFVHALADMRRWLKENQSPDARFTMMVDLYHLPHDFPSYDEGMAQSNGHQQAAILEAALYAELDDSRFIPYLQVHEHEALILVDPRRIATIYEVAHGQIDALCQECDAFATPEEINHGQHSHPKARIKQRVPEYAENIAGPLLAEDIGLANLRQHCPHFGEWLTRLEQLDS
jgi:Domain of unknown function (DUF4276)